MKIKRRGVTYTFDLTKIGRLLPKHMRHMSHKEICEYILNTYPTMECYEDYVSKESKSAGKRSMVSQMSDFDYFNSVDKVDHKRRITKQQNISKWLEFGLNLYPYEKHLSEVRKERIRKQKLMKQDIPPDRKT